MRLIREVVDHAIDLRIRERTPGEAVVRVILPAYMADRLREELAASITAPDQAINDAIVRRYFREAHNIEIEFGPPMPTIDFHKPEETP